MTFGMTEIKIMRYLMHKNYATEKTLRAFLRRKTPVYDHLNNLKDKGYIRIDMSDFRQYKYFITEIGRMEIIEESKKRIPLFKKFHSADKVDYETHSIEPFENGERPLVAYVNASHNDLGLNKATIIFDRNGLTIEFFGTDTGSIYMHNKRVRLESQQDAYEYIFKNLGDFEVPISIYNFNAKKMI